MISRLKNNRFQVWLGISFFILLACHSAVAQQKNEENEKTPAYSSNTSFSLVLTKGNNDTFSLSFDTEQNFQIKKNRLNLKGRFIRSNSENEKTSEIYYSNLKYAREINSKIYLVGFFRFERNKLAGYRARFAFSSGSGYFWLKQRRVKISSELTLAWNSESRLKSNPGEIEGLIFQEREYKSFSFLSSILTTKCVLDISKTSQFVQQETLFINMNDVEDYRLNSYSSLTVSINRLFALKASIQIIYEHLPVQGFKKTDFYLLNSLVIKI